VTNATDFDLLLEAVDPVTAELARGLLAEAGIPSLIHNQDFDVAELGTAVHHAVRHPDLYVPKGMREQAQTVLDEAWGDAGPDGETPDEDGGSDDSDEEDAPDLR
jgi:Putative prokaryotic signal transducing protein